MDLTISWLYGTKMNIYGDRGNVLALAQRARWRGIAVRTVEVGLGEPLPPESDVFFFGGGQDQEQVAVSRDLQGAKGDALKQAIADGAGMLAVCGGYQLLGQEYRPHDAAPLPGIGLFDLVTEAGAERFIGNVVVETDLPFGELVGFENHSGLTHLGPTATPLGRVRVGRGNNGQDGTEGAVLGNAIGCYLHGALLPKNPALADWLLLAGLRRRHGDVALPPLDDTAELAAHATAVDRAVRTR
ncbi:MAG: Putative amidotransferase similar to cobyric acid synthase [uncultured Thermomicrobiales bacterium]|uniref:Lipid II isoglutaminyl synthase (glutamine-hydrolyzing) subunit GatD n=1 Tax=uncultured Thermomicrobiales bacterium TaxID=1645740 RepID=A0A6J4U2F4_9BACT|nr:MAG: Putative amidotransferase similar to cobyric acid synthase [uncultured Thermomicrobiales bacterium]